MRRGVAAAVAVMVMATAGCAHSSSRLATAPVASAAPVPRPALSRPSATESAVSQASLSPAGLSPTATRASTPTAAPITTVRAVIPSEPDGDEQGLLDTERRTYGSPGALAAVQIHGRRWFESSGTADVTGTAITPGTRFRAASLTKPLVAALMLDAAARGEVSLDDDVATLLPGVLQPSAVPVTVRMLLDHTSGIFDEVDAGKPAVDVARIADASLRRAGSRLLALAAEGRRVVYPDRLLVALSETHPRLFPPGTGYHYSRTDYQLAGMVLEHATGRPLAALLQDRIATPLGLHDLTLAPTDRRPPQLRGYAPAPTGAALDDVTDDLRTFGNGGSGGVISTAGDLLSAMEALTAGRLLSRRQLVDMETPTPQSHLLYGLGLITYHLSCGTFYGHEGSAAGTVSIAVVSPDGSEGTVIALNKRGGGDPHLPVLASSLLCGT